MQEGFAEGLRADIPTASILDDAAIASADLLHVLDSPQGRRVIRRLFRLCNVFECMPVGDNAVYAWHEGRRHVGLVLFHQVFALGANFVTQLMQEDQNNV